VNDHIVTNVLYTQCRGCGEIFTLDCDTLTAAYGRVRCSVCGTVFNALDTLTDTLTESDLPLHEAGNTPPLLRHPDDTGTDAETNVQPERKPLTGNEPPPDTTPVTGDLLEPLADEPDVLAVEPLEIPAPSRAGPHWSRLWSGGSLVLAAALAWQGANGLRSGRLPAPETDWGRWLCQKLSCPGPNTPLLDLSRIATISSSIRPHPGYDNALIVSTTFMNTDSRPLPFPALEVSLSNLDGRTVAKRRFLPSEYLSDNLQESQMLPQTLIPVTLEILKPEGQANAFQISFSQPGGE